MRQKCNFSVHVSSSYVVLIWYAVCSGIEPRVCVWVHLGDRFSIRIPKLHCRSRHAKGKIRNKIQSNFVFVYIDIDSSSSLTGRRLRNQTLWLVFVWNNLVLLHLHHQPFIRPCAAHCQYNRINSNQWRLNFMYAFRSSWHVSYREWTVTPRSPCG